MGLKLFASVGLRVSRSHQPRLRAIMVHIPTRAYAIRQIVAGMRHPRQESNIYIYIYILLIYIWLLSRFLLSFRS